uniref:SoHo domain-containing protein n=1 Tax=Taeniopygia guttata TaxID=59729 RepID=A0A674H6A4_TAEGU
MGGPAPERGALGGQRTPGVPGHTGTQRRAGRSLPPLPGDISGGLSPPRCAETFPAPSPGQVPAVGFSSLRSQLRPARPGAAPQNPGASRGPRWHRPGGHGVKPRHTGSPRAPSPVPPGMAGRLLPPEPSPATAVGDVPPLHPPLQVSPQRTVTRVPVIRHRGSNTLNFHFHDPENSQGAPESSVNEWYQTWPAKEAKAPSTPMPTHPSPSPRAAPACPPGCSATWTKDSKRRERRWVKYDGIGPVDETGMPLASRSSVDSPRDWYRSMFRQIHRKLPGEAGHAGVARSGHGSAPAHLPHLRARLGHPFLPRHGASVAPQAAEEGLGPSGAPRDAQRDGLDPLGCRRCHRRAWQHFRLRTREFVPAGAEPGGSAARAGSVHRGEAAVAVAGGGQGVAGGGRGWQRVPVPAGGASPVLPPQVLLEQELEQLSHELDKDMRDMETRRDPRQVLQTPPAAPWTPQGIQLWAHPAVGTSSCGHTQLWAHPAVGTPSCGLGLCASLARARGGMHSWMHAWPDAACTSGLMLGWVRAHLGARTAGCVHSWMCAEVDANTAGCVHNWMCAEVDASTTGCVHNWMPAQLDVCITGCLHSWMCTQLDACTAGCVHDWMPAQLNVCTAGCVHHWMPAQLDACTTGCLHSWMCAQLDA